MRFTCIIPFISVHVHLGSTPDTDSENINITMFAAITITVIIVGMIAFLGLVLLFISKNKLKMLCRVSGIHNEMQRYNNIIYTLIHMILMHTINLYSDPQQTDRYMVREQQLFITQQLGVYSLVEPTAADKVLLYVTGA